MAWNQGGWPYRSISPWNQRNWHKLTPNLGKYASKMEVDRGWEFRGAWNFQTKMTDSRGRNFCELLWILWISKTFHHQKSHETSKNFKEFWEFQNRFIIKILKSQCKIGSWNHPKKLAKSAFSNLRKSFEIPGHNTTKPTLSILFPMGAILKLNFQFQFTTV